MPQNALGGQAWMPISSVYNYNDYYDTTSLYNNAITAFGNSIYTDAEKIWEREDSAYQRMVADMQKAGLNPWTGIASGGSQTGSTNPSMSAFEGLMAGLNYNLQVKNAQYRNDNALMSNLNSVFRTLLGFVKSVS